MHFHREKAQERLDLSGDLLHPGLDETLEAYEPLRPAEPAR